MIKTNKASVVFKALSGVACIYKPTCVSKQAVRSTILGNLCRELNELELDEPNKMVQIVGATNQPMKIEIQPNFAAHPLVTGPQFQPEDINCRISPKLGQNTSGVCLIGFQDGVKMVTQMYYSQLTKSYKLHGKFGSATDTYFINGKVVEKASYKHVTRSKIDKVVSYIQSMHQKKMFELVQNLLGVDMQSQEAFELATKGITRAVDKNIPMFYGIKCVHFDPPDFIIEVQCVNEYEKYLQTLIHDIGIQLRTVSHCTALQCVRYGKFTLEHAVLKKYWDLNYILESISTCKNIIKHHREVLYPDKYLQ